jgi:hypothetical protein
MSPLGRSKIDRKNPSCGKFVILPIARCCCETAVESSETSSGLGMALRDTTGPIRTSDFDSSRLSRNAEDVPPPPSRSANSVPGKVASRYRSEAVLDLPGAQRGRATTCGSPPPRPPERGPHPREDGDSMGYRWGIQDHQVGAAWGIRDRSPGAAWGIQDHQVGPAWGIRDRSAGTAWGMREGACGISANKRCKIERKPTTRAGE